jgi:ribonuclease HII
MARLRSTTSFTPSLERERELQTLGYARVCGVDEAGRGPLAGPVVAGAVLLPPDFSPADWPTLNDSKQLAPATREELFVRITSTCEYGVGIVSAQVIDEINIRQASWRAMQLAIEDLQTRNAMRGVLLVPDYVLIDGLPYGAGPWPYEAIVKGDAKSFSIAAASIIAKQTRDALMIALDEEYSGYDFAIHKGYGTPRHLQALQQLGPCALHRTTFAPVRAAFQSALQGAGSSPGTK